MAKKILEVHELTTKYITRQGEDVYSVDHVSLDIEEGKSLGIAGESGCGKSTLALSLMGYYFAPLHYTSGEIIIDGQWTTEDPDSYTMTYDPQQKLYTASILQKQGYYSYQYLWLKSDGTTHPLPSEGSFFQTENRYQAFVYFKGTGERTWRLTAYRNLQLK